MSAFCLLPSRRASIRGFRRSYRHRSAPSPHGIESGAQPARLAGGPSSAGSVAARKAGHTATGRHTPDHQRARLIAWGQPPAVRLRRNGLIGAARYWPDGAVHDCGEPHGIGALLDSVSAAGLGGRGSRARVAVCYRDRSRTVRWILRMCASGDSRCVITLDPSVLRVGRGVPGTVGKAAGTRSGCSAGVERVGRQRPILCCGRRPSLPPFRSIAGLDKKAEP